MPTTTTKRITHALDSVTRFFLLENDDDKFLLEDNVDNHFLLDGLSYSYHTKRVTGVT